MKHRKPMPHFCNTVRCTECIQAFWIWAENHTRGRIAGPKESPTKPRPVNHEPETSISFYEAAAKR